MSRLVVLTGTATLNQVVGEASSYDGIVRNALERQGFDVASVTINKPYYFGNTVNITISCRVDDAYTGEDARRSAISVISSISNFTGSALTAVLPTAALLSLAQSRTLFSGVSLSILSDGQPATTRTDATLNDALSNITNFGAGLAKTATSNITSNIGTPIALAALGGFALFLIVLTMPRR